MEFNTEYIERLTDKIEKLTGLTDWDNIRIQYKLPYQNGYELFEDMIDECYPETDILWQGKREASILLKCISNLDYGMAISEYFDNQTEDGVLFSYHYTLEDYKNYKDRNRIQIFYREDLENLLKKLETKGSK